MSLTSSLNNALTGLAATQRLAEVTSSNISNALTDGYGRRELVLSSQSIGGQGAGVKIEGVSRQVDPVILSDRRLAGAELSQRQMRSDTFSRIEQIVGVPGDGTGLSARLVAFETALVAASSDPASTSRLSVAVNRLGELTGALNQATRDLQTMRQEADAQIATAVETLNTSLRQIEELNGDIARANIIGGDPSALEDQRQRAVDKIAELVPVREVKRDNGAIALYSTSGATLLDGKAGLFTFGRTPTISADMTFAAGSLSGIEYNGTPLDPSNGFGRLSGGGLEAAFETRDNFAVEAQSGLDFIAADLITRFENPVNDPSLFPGDPGLLTDNGAIYDVSIIEGLAGRIQINSVVDPILGGDATRLRDGVGAAVPGPVGDATQINRWIASLQNTATPDVSLIPTSANGRISDLGDQIGTQRVVADENAAFTAARWDSLRQSELANGVDTDQEMQKLLLIEQAYAANAKLIQTVSSMIQTLMEI